MTDAPKPLDAKGQSVAVAVQPPAATPAMFRTPDEFAGMVYSSLPVERRDEFLVALQSDATPVREMAGRIIEAEHIIAHRIEMIDTETGELIEADRIVLMTPAGDMFGCVSSGIRRSIQLLMATYGMPPWSPAIPLAMVEKQTRKGRRMYQLLPASAVAKGKGQRVK